MGKADMAASSCWRDVRNPSQWRGIGYTVVCFYLLFANQMIRNWNQPYVLWEKLEFVTVLLAILSAMYAASRGYVAVRPGTLCGDSVSPESSASFKAVRRAVVRGLRKAFLFPIAVYLLPASVYLAIALLHKGERFEAVLAFVLDGLVCVCASVVLGAAVVGRRRFWAIMRALLLSLAFIGMRELLAGGAVGTLLPEFGRQYGSLITHPSLACADALLCALVLMVSGWVARTRHTAHLTRTGPASIAYSVQQTLTSVARRCNQDQIELAGLGLDVSAWSLLRWRFWRDPLFRL
jgi:hypothetical protein